MSEIDQLRGTNHVRLQKASKLTIAQIEEARRIAETTSGVSLSEETTLALANILAINYLAVVRSAKD